MTPRLREDAMTVFRAGITSANPFDAIHRWLRMDAGNLVVGPAAAPTDVISLSAVRNVVVVGGGKATAGMARAVEMILGNRLTEGAIAVPYGQESTLQRVRVYHAGHPVPDEQGVAAGQAVAEIAVKTDEADLVIALISGGASALLPSPLPGILLSDKQQVTSQLLRSGANITELNIVRKHLSLLKGGGLARLAAPALLHSFIISDVVGDDPGTIASGLTAADPSTCADAVDILRRYGIWENIPDAVRNHLNAGTPETPKLRDPIFSRVHNHIIATNRDALAAMENTAATMGYVVHVVPDPVVGEAREAATAHVKRCREILKADPGRPACILAGGETTVTVRGDGVGGRNQEFALAAAVAMEGWENVLLLSAGTDGIDGPTSAAGAIADGTTLARGKWRGKQYAAYLGRNDSSNFFSSLGDLVVTGGTGTNVMDVVIIMIA
jgi:glycerate 2-kinase